MAVRGLDCGRSETSLPLPFPLSGVIPLLGVLGKLRALGVNAALRFLLRDVGLGDLGPRCLTDVLVKLIFLTCSFRGARAIASSSLVD